MGDAASRALDDSCCMEKTRELGWCQAYDMTDFDMDTIIQEELDRLFKLGRCSPDNAGNISKQRLLAIISELHSRGYHKSTVKISKELLDRARDDGLVSTPDLVDWLRTHVISDEKALHNLFGRSLITRRIAGTLYWQTAMDHSQANMEKVLAGEIAHFYEAIGESVPSEQELEMATMKRFAKNNLSDVSYLSAAEFRTVLVCSMAEVYDKNKHNSMTNPDIQHRRYSQMHHGMLAGG